MEAYFWTSTSPMMVCYRCSAVSCYVRQITCWFSATQRHYTIWTCTIQRWMRRVQSLYKWEENENNIYVPYIHLDSLKTFQANAFRACVRQENGYLMEIYTLHIAWKQFTGTKKPQTHTRAHTPHTVHTLKSEKLRFHLQCGLGGQRLRTFIWYFISFTGSLQWADQSERQVICYVNL